MNFARSGDGFLFPPPVPGECPDGRSTRDKIRHELAVYDCGPELCVSLPSSCSSACRKGRASDKRLKRKVCDVDVGETRVRSTQDSSFNGEMEDVSLETSKQEIEFRLRLPVGSPPSAAHEFASFWTNGGRSAHVFS